MTRFPRSFRTTAMLVMAGVFCIVLAWRVRQIGRATTYRYWSEWWWADAL